MSVFDVIETPIYTVVSKFNFFILTSFMSHWQKKTKIHQNQGYIDKKYIFSSPYVTYPDGFT